MALETWSQEVVAAWRPTLTYYKVRFDLLDEVRAQVGSASSFRVEEDEVGLRFDSGLHEVALGPSSIRFIVLTPDLETEVIQSVLDTCLAGLDISGNTLMRGAFQHLAPLDYNYDAARRSTSRRLLADISPELLPTDWSLLVDGEAPDGSIKFQSEFGVVEESEIQERVSRQAGRTTGEAQALPRAWNDLEKPDVALFADTTFGSQSGVPAEPAVIWEKWQDSLHNVEEFLAEVLSGISDGEL